MINLVGLLEKSNGVKSNGAKSALDSYSVVARVKSRTDPIPQNDKDFQPIEKNRGLAVLSRLGADNKAVSLDPICFIWENY
jgi:hypothetical protein